jgi:hypothetical protein
MIQPYSANSYACPRKFTVGMENNILNYSLNYILAPFMDNLRLNFARVDGQLN